MVVCVVVLVAGTQLATVTADTRDAAASVSLRKGIDPLPAAVPGVIRITQANLLSGQPSDLFAADVATVMEAQPDFITYNEVPYRTDASLAPAPYQVWRTPGKYTGATPVAWRTDRWVAQATGTYMVSDRPGKSAHQSVELGIRYANWVTVRNVSDGRIVSVISAHLAPETPQTEGLLAPSIDRLGALAASLGAQGPVLMAGDFNVHYPGASYPRTQLANWGLTPTYDALGTYFPTGDHKGATIDYVFMRTAGDFTVSGQYNRELNSDHDAVTADVSLIGAGGAGVVSFPSGVVTNGGASLGRQSRRAVLDLLAKAVTNAQKGATVRLVSSAVTDGKVVNALTAAKKRGVDVQVIIGAHRLVRREQRLQRVLGQSFKTRSWATVCETQCHRVAVRKGVPMTGLTVSQSGASTSVRIDVNQGATFQSAKVPTKATVTSDPTSYNASVKTFARLAAIQRARS